VLEIYGQLVVVGNIDEMNTWFNCYVQQNILRTSGGLALLSPFLFGLRLPNRVEKAVAHGLGDLKY
jgi:hypothetical protein